MVKFKLPCVKYACWYLCKCDLFKKELDLFYILDRSILNICVGYSVVFCFSAKCRNLVMNCSLNAYVFMHFAHWINLSVVQKVAKLDLFLGDSITMQTDFWTFFTTHTSQIQEVSKKIFSKGKGRDKGGPLQILNATTPLLWVWTII